MVIGVGGTIRFSGGFLSGHVPQIVDNGTILFDGSPDEASGVEVVGTGSLVMDISGTLSGICQNHLQRRHYAPLWYSRSGWSVGTQPKFGFFSELQLHSQFERV